MIPLSLRLKRELHRKIAAAQDIIVEQVYKKFDKAVLHGGTAIWRCYNGKRFSEDLDFYIQKNHKLAKELFEELKKKGFKIIKEKIAENSIYSELEIDRTRVRLEATFQDIKGHLSDYEASDGSIISIYSLTPEEFIKEKAETYLKRFKIRDLYDIFFLLKFAKDFKMHELKKLIQNYKKPDDEEDLKTLIWEGIAPSSKEMIEYIKIKWEK